MIKIGFVILTWNSEKYISECIKSVLSINNDKLHSEIIIVDNGSTDRTIRDIEKYVCDYCELIKLSHNFGTTYSRNIAMEKMMKKKVDYICILDSDTIVSYSAFVTMIKELENDKYCGMIGPKMYDSQGVYQYSGREIPTVIEKVMKILPLKITQKIGRKFESKITEDGSGSIEVGYLMSACWLVKRELIEKIGYLDEKIFYAPEDVEYCIRCWKSNMSVKYCYDARIMHEWQRLSRKKIISIHNYEHVKGLIYMFMKHKYIVNSKKFMKIRRK